MTRPNTASAWPSSDLAPPPGQGSGSIHPRNRQRHSGWLIALHWGTVLAIVLALVAVWWRDAIEDKALRNFLMDSHRQLGLFVLLALGLRLAVRLGVGMKDFAAKAPPLMHLAAVAAHIALYAALLALPLLGWASSNAHGVEMRLFGLLPLPMLVADDPDLADTLTDWHLWASWGLGALVLAHVAAAAWHHWWQRDGVLSAMLPLVKRRGR